jgi:tetratricopeptide (TPR) repeat protein
MDGFAPVAPYLTHPLVLAGFGLFLFFGLLRALLKSPVMPQVSRTAGGQALLSLLRYGFLLALVVIVLGFALVFFREAHADPLLQWGALGGALLVCALASRHVFRAERDRVDVDQIIREFTAAKERIAAHESTLEGVKRLAELEDANAFRAAVIALIGQARRPEVPGDVGRAIQLLRQGQAGPAEAIFERVLAQKQAEGAAALKEAAAAARHLGALAYLDDTAKALEAYTTATRLDPNDTHSWIFLGRLNARAGDLAAAEQAYRAAREAAERAGNERDLMVTHNDLGAVQQARGELGDALAGYEAGLVIVKRLVEADSANTEWQRDLSVS